MGPLTILEIVGAISDMLGVAEPVANVLKQGIQGSWQKQLAIASWKTLDKAIRHYKWPVQFTQIEQTKNNREKIVQSDEFKEMQLLRDEISKSKQDIDIDEFAKNFLKVVMPGMDKNNFSGRGAQNLDGCKQMEKTLKANGRTNANMKWCAELYDENGDTIVRFYIPLDEQKERN